METQPTGESLIVTYEFFYQGQTMNGVWDITFIKMIELLFLGNGTPATGQ
jgi:hypothetical protein